MQHQIETYQIGSEQLLECKEDIFRKIW